MLNFGIFLNLDKLINEVTGGIIEVCIDVSLANADNNMHMQIWSKKCEKPSRPSHTKLYIFFLTFLSFQRTYIICRCLLKMTIV